MRLVPRELHRTTRPSSTAEATTIARAVELHRPRSQQIVTDDFAPLFLSTAGRAAVRVIPRTMPGLGIMNLRKIVLTPIDSH